MRFTKRAFLYVIRKKGKSILLFALLLIMATFVLTGLSIWKASGDAQLNLRQSLGGKFNIGIDWENSPYVVQEILQDNEYDEESGKTMHNYIMYSTKQFSPEDVAAIKEIEGIKYCDARTDSLVPFEELSLFAGTIPIEEKYSHRTMVYGAWDTGDTEPFTSEALALTTGRHIIPGDKNVAVISEDLAQKSGLKIGDFISTHRYNAEEEGYTGEEIRVEIVGLFTPKELEPFGDMVTTYDKIQNCVFVDLQTSVEIENSANFHGFNTINVTIDDPLQMDQVISDVKALSAIDWNAFTVNADNETYENAAMPLSTLNELIAALLAAIVVVSAIILALILTLWTKTRIHEIGVFLSVGIRKSAIIGQYLMEVLLIAVLAFSLSFFTSRAVAGQICNRLLEQSIPAEPEEDSLTASAASVEIGGDSFVEKPLPAETQIHVTVGLDNLIQLYLIGLAVIIAAVSISSITVMRLKPREILSKMS